MQSRFDFDGDCKDWVLKSIAKKRRAWKATIKSNYYNLFENDEDRVRACQDSRIDLDQLKEALDFWNSEKGQVSTTMFLITIRVIANLFTFSESGHQYEE